MKVIGCSRGFKQLWWQKPVHLPLADIKLADIGWKLTLPGLCG
jgi:hypothetical protein